MELNIQVIINALQSSWGKDTAFDPSEWSEDNRARGQCVVSSLVIQDYLGGELVRYMIDEGNLHETHYANMLDGGTILDTTASQYSQPVTMRIKPIDLKGFASARKKRLADDSTRKRYEILKARVDQLLAESIRA
jgi:hypothetical protein